ncbi:MAG TPA: DUF5777 family beta-barrel protein [Lentimicrobium sp.]|nr:DUF5777 family beta-barrel protein [Lentimicrobium sp.]
MRRIKFIIAFLAVTSSSGNLFSQDLMDVFGNDSVQSEYAYATFKSTRIVLGQSIENPAAGTLQFLVQHNFGSIDQGAYNMWGLDQSTIRLAFEYGINDRLSVGIGRSSFEKTFDGSVKYKLLRQKTGLKKMPVAVSLFGSTTLNSLKWTDPERKNYFSSRLAYVAQLLIARKFSNSLSLQLTPTYIHKNLVALRTQQNDVFAAGLGGRYKLSKRTSVNAEYFYLLPGRAADQYQDCLSVGVDIETGGHVFNLRLTNAQPLFETAFISETTGKWSDKGVYFGFTINRVFTIKHKNR